MIYIHPSLRRLLIRRSVKYSFDVLYNIISYYMNMINKNRKTKLITGAL